MRHFLLVSVACLLLGSLAGCPLGVGPDRANVDTFEKIQVGMTMQEVEKMLGRPGLPMERRAAPEKDDKIPAEAKWMWWKFDRSSQPKHMEIAFIDEKVVAKKIVGLSVAGKDKAVEKQGKKAD